MVDKIPNKIPATDVLKALEKEDYKTSIFVDKNEITNTFMTYKGRVVELNKIKVSILANKMTVKEAEEKIRTNIIGAAFMGEWLAFVLDKNPNFNINDFFKQFSFYSSEEKFFDSKAALTRDYYTKTHKLLKDDEDLDAMKNKGFWNPRDGFKILFISNADDEDIETFKSNNSTFGYDFYYIK